VNRTSDRALIFGACLMQTIGWGRQFIALARMVQPKWTALCHCRAELHGAF